jgi:hypothetical protein
VLKECVERVPETYCAARELLLFGLQGTDIEAFISVADGEDCTCCQCITWCKEIHCKESYCREPKYCNVINELNNSVFF